jgi:hypothetical protein
VPQTLKYFGTVQLSMMTLMQVMTLDAWTDLSRLYWHASPATTVLLIIFMVCAALVLMNLLSAIFVDRLIQLTDEEKLISEKKKQEKKDEFAKKLRHIFMAFDQDGNGTLTESELKKGIAILDTGDGSTAIEKSFQNAGLDQKDMDDLMKYMSVGNMLDGAEVDYNEFILGIFSLDKPVQRKDALEIMSQVRLLHMAHDKNAATHKKHEKRWKELESRTLRIEDMLTQLLEAQHIEPKSRPASPASPTEWSSVKGNLLPGLSPKLKPRSPPKIGDL